MLALRILVCMILGSDLTSLSLSVIFYKMRYLLVPEKEKPLFSLLEDMALMVCVAYSRVKYATV